jgi:hypothetical protein
MLKIASISAIALFALCLLGLFVIAMPALAWQELPPDLPAGYYGQIESYPGLFTPTVGITVSAWISGVLCGQTWAEEYEGQIVYAIKVPADGGDAPGCGALGRTLKFYVGGQPMVDHIPWDNSEWHEVNLVYDPTAVRLSCLRPASGQARWSGQLLGLGLACASVGALVLRRRQDGFRYKACAMEK